jgi:hypothetical protein
MTIDIPLLQGEKRREEERGGGSQWIGIGIYGMR